MNIITRRDFLKLTGLTAGGLVLGTQLQGCSTKTPSDFRANVFINFLGEDKVQIVCHRSEMGQGIRTSLIQMMADELEYPLEKVEMIQAEGDKKYGDQNTDGSKSIRDNWIRLRELAASTRNLFERAAAKKWKVSDKECKAELGYIICQSKKMSYLDLLEEASKLKPIKARLKEKSEFRYIGKGITSLDIKELISGKAVFGMDFELDSEEMLFVSLVRSPVPGGKVKKLNDKEALKVQGVKQVIQLKELPQDMNTSNSVGVVATNTWAALEGCKQLEISWDLSSVNKMNDKKMQTALKTELNKSKPGKIYRKNSSKEKVTPKSTYKAEFYTPFLVHAPMEPLVATAKVTTDFCEVWAPTQHPQRARTSIAKFLSLPEEKVKVNVTFLGGGFGRKSQPDFILEAVYASQILKKPVKLTWSREDEVKHGFYHPSALQRIEVGLDKDKKPLNWKHKSVFSSMMSVFSPKVTEPADWELALGASTLPYHFKNIEVQASHVETPVRRAWLRSVHNIFHAFAIGTVIDELARQVSTDPIDFSLSLLKEDQMVEKQDINRLRHVIETVREKSHWKKRQAEGKLLGFAHHYSFNSYLAFVVEVEKVDGELPRIKEVDCVLDCGQYMNENIVRAQMEGSIIFGMSIVNYGKITLDENSAIEQGNFDDYPVQRISETPKMNIHLIDNGLAPQGVGEPAVPAFIPAYTNAVARATGKNIRELPIKA